MRNIINTYYFFNLLFIFTISYIFSYFSVFNYKIFIYKNYHFFFLLLPPVYLVRWSKTRANINIQHRRKIGLINYLLNFTLTNGQTHFELRKLQVLCQLDDFLLKRTNSPNFLRATSLLAFGCFCFFKETRSLDNKFHFSSSCRHSVYTEICPTFSFSHKFF
jgi:hypothetical protein